MKRQMRLITSDEPVNDFKMAREKERHDRNETMTRWISEGKAYVLCNNDPICINILCGTETFSCGREEFPTTLMIAQIGLAIASGQVVPQPGDHVAREKWVRYSIAEMQAIYGIKIRKGRP